MPKQIVVINPGSTSTKTALFMDSKMIFSINVEHDSSSLHQFPEIVDQLDFRKQAVLEQLEKEHILISE